MGTSAPMNLPNMTFGINSRWPSLNTDWQTFPGHYLLYAATGTFTLEVDDRQWLLPPQRAAWVAADVLIRLHAKSPVTSSSILFAKGTIPTPPFDCRVFSISPLAREMILYAMRWGMDRDPEDKAADAFFASVAGVCAELAAEPERFWLPRARSEELICAIDYIMQNLEHSLTVEGIAQAVNLSARTLARRFTDEAHMTCGQFIHRVRLLRAMELLAEQTNAPIIDVSYAVGFESLSAFTSAFRSFTQETPSAYRKRFQPQ